MKEFKKIFLIVLTILTFCIACTSSKKNSGSNTHPNSPAPDELFNEISHMDSIMFNAFNAHDLEKLKTTFSENLEFYHDKGGLADFDQTMKNFKSLFEKNRNTGLRRDIVKGSLEVYPIKDYGAVEICLHRFCHVENDKNDCGVFKNIMIWQNNNGTWKVTRVISYDH
jgi:hypothetical protein